MSDEHPQEDALRLVAAMRACSDRVEAVTPDRTPDGPTGVVVDDGMVRRALSGLDVDYESFMLWIARLWETQAERIGHPVRTANGEDYEIGFSDVAGNLILHAFVTGAFHERYLHTERPPVEGQ